MRIEQAKRLKELSQDYGIIKTRGMASESQEGREDLEARRLEGAQEATEEKAPVA